MIYTIEGNSAGDRCRGNRYAMGNELLAPDEVRMLDNRYALLFIRGERPIMDLKYNILRHPFIGYTTDGGAKPFLHGEDTRNIAALQCTPELLEKAGYQGPLIMHGLSEGQVPESKKFLEGILGNG